MPFRGLKVAQYDHQEIVEVVSDATAQLSDGFHLLRCRQLLLGLLQQFLRLMAIRDVASHLSKADQLSLIIAEWHR